MIEARALYKKFDNGIIAVNNINFTVKAGEVFCIYGANGAGKTTTINMFLNFLLPTSGNVLIDNIDVCKQPLLAKSHLAYLSENVRLYENFSAVENALFFARLTPNNNVTTEDCQQALIECGLDEKFHFQRLSDFSKGMRQKTGLAICLLKKSKAIILDEPLSGLDPTAVENMLMMITKLSNSGVAILMSTHDLLRTQQIADKIAIMKQGNIIVDFDCEMLLKQDLFKIYQESVSDVIS